MKGTRAISYKKKLKMYHMFSSQNITLLSTSDPLSISPCEKTQGINARVRRLIGGG
jgi:hypothetical protein